MKKESVIVLTDGEIVVEPVVVSWCHAALPTVFPSDALCDTLLMDTEGSALTSLVLTVEATFSGFFVSI